MWLSAIIQLILSWQKPLSYRNQCIDLQSKLMDWFLYNNDLRPPFIKHVYKSLKGAFSHLRQFLTFKNPLKMMKNAFYFTLKETLTVYDNFQRNLL